MAKPELGSKRVCPETGRKFYDLNKDPIVSPYTGKEYPLSYFEDTAVSKVPEKEEPAVAEVDDENEAEVVEVVSLEEADDETTKTGSKDADIPDLDDDDGVEIEDDDEDDTFLADDDDDDDDVSDIINVNDDDDDS
ncbi:TIGR02300 family protein [Pseudohoeflea coraliihabitans]|uniref:TIGR02300 family protein n=1 Tax=Pseudohoeflea coraliihabitans TaxID=2860393 RepID=A0ABS6WP60_9HYPH|nr:TIGR02300 family protein [Pseudohoeflea sp. DP4N28-3]